MIGTRKVMDNIDDALYKASLITKDKSALRDLAISEAIDMQLTNGRRGALTYEYWKNSLRPLYRKEDARERLQRKLREKREKKQ